MHRSTRLLPLLLLTAAVPACARTLTPREWVTALPRGQCEVAVERNDATGTWTLARHHAADGRVLSGTARLRYHGRAWERFVYDARGRLAAIDSYEDIDAESFPCDSTRGCDTPPRRTVTHTAVDHDDAGRLTRWDREERTYFRERDGGAYSSNRAERNDRAFAYDARGRLVEIRGWEGRRTRLLYAGDRLARIDRGGEFPSYVVLEHDAQGRIARAAESNCTRERLCHVARRLRYSYDPAGRLARVDRDDPTGQSNPGYTGYDYDGAAGARVARTTRVELHPASGREDRLVFEYGYDARGRLVSLAQDGVVRERRRYQGACDAVTTGPRAPSPLDELGAVVCPESPAYVMDQCFAP